MSEIPVQAPPPADGAAPPVTPAPSPPPAPTTAPAPSPEGADWRSTITDETLREHAGRFTTVADLVKDHAGLRDKLQTALVVPKDGAPPEEVAAFRKALGVPDKPDGYKLPAADALNEDGKRVLSGVVAKMHAAGAPPAVVEAAVGTYLTHVAEVEQAQAAAAQRAVEAGISDLRREWGADFDANVEFAKRGAQQFGGDGFRAFLDGAKVDGVPIGSHPAFVKVFAEIGRRMGEDGFQASALSGSAAQTVQEQIDALHTEQQKALARGDGAAAKRIDAQLADKYKRLYGE